MGDLKYVVSRTGTDATEIHILPVKAAGLSYSNNMSRLRPYRRAGKRL